MKPNTQYSYLVAEDEPALAKELVAHIEHYWPSGFCCGVAQTGDEALRLAREEEPRVMFLDVRMPGKDGITVARELCSEPKVPLMVFVTAFDQYALDAFETAALDYLLKPLEPERLMVCLNRLEQRLRADHQPPLDQLLAQLQQIAPRTSAKPFLNYLRVGSEEGVRIIAVKDVLYFEARDKYVLVVTRQREALMRTSLRELSLELDPAQFWQIHRSTIVNADAIRGADRDAVGRLRVSLHDHSQRLVVSRQFTHLFKPM